jgi:hypothetical protein
MNLSSLPTDLHYFIMGYLCNNHDVYKQLHSKKLQQYVDIYNTDVKKNNKAYIISGPSAYPRTKKIDYQIYQYSNYLYVSNNELLADSIGQSPSISYLTKKLNTPNIFINEIIKILLFKNTLQSLYPGNITDVIITVNTSDKYLFYEKIDKQTVIEVNSFS